MEEVRLVEKVRALRVVPDRRVAFTCDHDFNQAVVRTFGGVIVNLFLEVLPAVNLRRIPVEQFGCLFLRPLVARYRQNSFDVLRQVRLLSGFGLFPLLEQLGKLVTDEHI